MTLFISRNLEALLYPLGLAWLALALATFWYLRKKRCRSAFCAGSLSLILWLVGATPLPELLLSTLEKPFRENTVAKAPSANAIIVLGGFIDPSAHDAFGFSVNSATDRIITGVELLRAGKAPALLIGGGPSILDGKPSSEGAHVQAWLKSWKVVPNAEILTLGPCRNTRDEALATRALLQQRSWTNVILVTSAFHMSRALATFRKHGIDAHPVACDFEGLPAIEGQGANWRVVPIMDHVNSLNLFIHELIGCAYYKLRGWI